MTEYGRGQGPQPWHPEDPLYGDQGWSGGQSASGTYQDGWEQYDGQQQAPQQQTYYPQQAAQPQHAGYGDGNWDGTQGGGTQGGGVVYDPAYGAGATDPYGIPPVGHYGPDGQPVHYGAEGGYPPPQPQHPQQAQQYPQDPYQQDPRYAQQDPHYGQQYAQDPYQQESPYPQDPGYPQQYQEPPHQAPHQAPHQPPHQRPHPEQPPGADPETGWDPGPDQGEHAFFTDREDAEDVEGADWDDSDGGRPGREGRKDGRNGRGSKRRGETKRRSGCACLVVSVVLVGGVGAVGWFGWDFYQTHFAPSPDYEGRGGGEIQVDIPDGASLTDMGTALHSAGVIKSSGAFVEAASENSKAQSIQPGSYTLRKRMAAASAIDMMLDPASQNGLIVSEGLRATKIYSLVDAKLDLKDGTTAKAAETADLGLPKWAKGQPEGFLFPSKYSVGKKTAPEDVLRQMVKRAKAEYTKVGLEDAAKKSGQTPEEIITVASLVQAEAQEDHEFGKVSRVIYNRLDENMALGFDSTINYAKGRSTLDVSVQDTKFDSPYNTYMHKGLPPGPIDNPGHQAIEAALKPTKGDWLYFVTVKPGDTRFTDNSAEHDKNVRDFNIEQRKKRENGG
ncbi:endolytic transglycosylase MltG [Streptomyces sp. NPDC054796]